VRHIPLYLWVIALLSTALVALMVVGCAQPVVTAVKPHFGGWTADSCVTYTTEPETSVCSSHTVAVDPANVDAAQ
jgi:hypothetical protein